MDALELKKEFHELIDRVDNTSLLSAFYDALKKRISLKEGQLWRNLTKEQQEELLLAFEESEDPQNLISHDDMIKKNKRWL